MIETYELRRIANKTDWDGSKIYFSSIALWMEDVANELDRLYEIERRNTPLTREQIEAELVRRGFELRYSSDYIVRLERGKFWVWIWELELETNDEKANVTRAPLSAVTLQLLDAVLGAK